MFMTPVISTTTRITADSFGLMHLNALNNSSFHSGDTHTSSCVSNPPTYEDAVSFTLLKSLQADQNLHYSRNLGFQGRTTSSTASTSNCEQQTETPPSYDEVIQEAAGEQETNNIDVRSTVLVNSGRVAENALGRLSIFSRTSITGFGVPRDAQISVQTKRARKRKIRHYSCVAFASIVALGIPAFIVLMMSGVFTNAHPQESNDSKNETQRSDMFEELPAGEIEFRRKRESNIIGQSGAYFVGQIPEKEKRYQDMLYRVNYSRMYSGLHNHKQFIQKFMDVFMKNHTPNIPLR